MGGRRQAAQSPLAAAFSAATLACGSCALLIAATLVVLRVLNSPPGHDSAAALPLLLPLAVLMVIAHRRPVLPVMLVHLVLGVAAIGLYSSVIIRNAPESVVESPFILALPQTALVYTIAPLVQGVRSIVFIASAYLLGQLAVLVAAAEAGRFPDVDYVTAIATAVLLAVPTADLVTRRRTAADRRAVQRALRDSDAIAYQQELERQVIALFHDTVLSELTVLAQQSPGPLAESQKAAIARDLTLMRSGAWWPSETPGDRGGLERSELPPLLAEMLDASRREGLTVELLGDLASLHRLSPAVSTAVALAVRQALVNVSQHAGVDRAEIVVDGAPDAVVLMITDAGVGFDPAAVPAEHLGVSSSIQGRIRSAGGQCQLWTSPGTGTAYLFTLPVAPEHTWPDPEEGS
ncbi:MAG: hypothetical protein Q7T71_08660 [Herbiconiux sp.]|nr:hypothetical protein [Herbiconiux sp.]